MARTLPKDREELTNLQFGHPLISECFGMSEALFSDMWINA